MPPDEEQVEKFLENLKKAIEHRDLIERALRSAELYCLDQDFKESFKKYYVEENMSIEEAVFHALYDWDIALVMDEVVLDEDGKKCPPTN